MNRSSTLLSCKNVVLKMHHIYHDAVKSDLSFAKNWEKNRTLNTGSLLRALQIRRANPNLLKKSHHLRKTNHRLTWD